jgi:hypothetical protein
MYGVNIVMCTMYGVDIVMCTMYGVKQNKIYPKINIDKGYLSSSIYVGRGGNIGLYKFLFNMTNGTYYNMNITILTLSSTVS